SFATAAMQLILWDTATSQKRWTSSIEAASVVLQTAFSPDGRQVLARLLGENSARLFDAQTGKPVGAALRHDMIVDVALFSPDGQLVLTCSSDLTARLWETSLGLPIGPAWKNQKNGPRGTFSADGKSILLSEDSAIARWEIPPPMEGTPERIRLAVEAATRRFVDEHGEVKLLRPVLSPQESVQAKRPIPTADPYEIVRKRLENLGGPPGELRR